MSSYLEPLDDKNPNAVVNLTHGSLKEALLEISEELALCTEAELKQRVQPTPTDYSLRTSFWREYERVVRSGGNRITTRAVFSGVCSDAYFYQKFLKDRLRLAWMMRPVQTYMKEVEAILMRGTERLWELMDMDITHKEKGGRVVVDPKRASVLLEAIKMVEQRAKGMAVQRSESKSLSVNASVKSPQLVAQGASEETIDVAIKEMEDKVYGNKPIDPESGL